jgi:hypothetical protein
LAKGQRGKPSAEFTEQDWIDRFRQLPSAAHAGQNQHDWIKLFIEYIRSTQSEYRSVQHFCEAKGISYPAIQSRGGTALWNRARRSIQFRALTKAVDKSTNIVAQKYEKEIEVSYNLVEVIKRSTRRLLKASEPLSDGSDPPPNPYEASAIKTLAESIKLLAETNMKLFGDLKSSGDGTAQIPVIDIHNMLVQVVAQRDKALGVEE